MTKLPPPRAIKAAILKMDSTVVPREGIEKLLNMLPTDEERGKIQEAQVNNPELPRKLMNFYAACKFSAYLNIYCINYWKA